MNLILIGSAHPLRGGGIATFNERLAKAFMEEGHDITIYTFRLQYPSFLFPGKTQYSDEPPPHGLKIVVAVNSVNPFNWIMTGLRIRKLRPDIVILRYWLPFMAPCLGTIARIIRTNRHTRIVAITDNIIPHEKKPGDRMLTRYFVGSCDAFITLSRSVLEDLNEFGTKKPKFFCPHPLYDNFGDMMSRENALELLGLETSFRYLLFFGFIRPYKGLRLLLQAFADPRLRKLPIKLIIAGEYYEDSAPYRQLISSSGLVSCIIGRTDFIPNNEVARYFCAADLVVQPYLEATQSGVTQVAYHFDKPMIVTRVGGLAETVPDGKAGYVVDKSPAQIAEAILDFYSHNRESEFIRNIKEEKKRFSWKNLTSIILSAGKKEQDG